MVTQIVWRLRSPFSGAVTECLVIENQQRACELLIVPVEKNQRPSSSPYPDFDAATRSAAVLASTLRAEGWTDTSDEQPA